MTFLFKTLRFHHLFKLEVDSLSSVKRSRSLSSVISSKNFLPSWLIYSPIEKVIQVTPVLQQSHRNYSLNFTPIRSFATKPLELKDVENRVMESIRLYDKIDAEKLTATSHFINDLGLDSLDHVEVLMAIENEFGEAIPDADAERLLTPQAIIDYLAKLHCVSKP